MTTTDRSRQVRDFWAGDFGNSYTERNAATEQAVLSRVRQWVRIWDRLRGEEPASVLECGCNLGLNLRAIRRISSAELFGVEPNGKAREIAVQDGILAPDHLFDATLDQLPFADASKDLVFTAGVLIHVPPERLEQACREMYRVSSRYILAIEYFSKSPETIKYRGNEGLLFKRDFGGFWQDLFPDLVPLDQGFLWARTTNFDDSTWWLFRKP